MGVVSLMLSALVLGKYLKNGLPTFSLEFGFLLELTQDPRNLLRVGEGGRHCQLIAGLAKQTFFRGEDYRLRLLQLIYQLKEQAIELQSRQNFQRVMAIKFLVTVAVALLTRELLSQVLAIRLSEAVSDFEQLGLSVLPLVGKGLFVILERLYPPPWALQGGASPEISLAPNGQRYVKDLLTLPSSEQGIFAFQRPNRASLQDLAIGVFAKDQEFKAAKRHLIRLLPVFELASFALIVILTQASLAWQMSETPLL